LIPQKVKQKMLQVGGITAGQVVPITSHAMPWNWDLDLKLSISMGLVGKTIKLSRPLDLVMYSLAANCEVESLPVS